MYKVHLKGKKIAALLAWANLRGYDEAEVTYEDGTDDDYIIHCEISTKWDANPFIGTPQTWNGEVKDLSEYDEDSIRDGMYYDALEGYDAQYLSGYLGLDIEMLNVPDDDGVPVCVFTKYQNGECVEDSRFANEEFEMDTSMFQIDPWHDFSF